MGAAAVTSRHLKTLQNPQVAHDYVAPLARVRQSQKLGEREITHDCAGNLQLVLRLLVQVSHEIAHDKPEERLGLHFEHVVVAAEDLDVSLVERQRSLVSLHIGLGEQLLLAAAEPVE